MRYFLLIFLSAVLLSSCQKPAPGPKTASPNAKRFTLIGKVINVNKAKKTVAIDHQSIPDYMEGMTMDFPVHNDDILNTLTKDSEIKADLVVDQGEFWLENISIVAAPNPDKPAPTPNESFAYEGKQIPDFKLTNQDAKPISMADFHGKYLAITFIYTRCPLPNYCILMSKNFSDLALQMESKPDLKNKLRLLSISFDPAVDTPATLKKYGLGYLGKDAKYDFTGWQLATAPDKDIAEIATFFGLRYETDEKDKTQINHSLKTIIVTPEGKVKKIFTGNEWTVDQLVKEVE